MIKPSDANCVRQTSVLSEKQCVMGGRRGKERGRRGRETLKYLFFFGRPVLPRVCKKNFLCRICTGLDSFRRLANRNASGPCSRPRGGAVIGPSNPAHRALSGTHVGIRFFLLPSATVGQIRQIHSAWPAPAQLLQLNLAMFCARCLRSCSVRRPATLIVARTYAVASLGPSKPLPSSTPAGEAASAGSPPKLSPQPFSTPLTPAPAKAAKKPNAVISGTLAGTPLRHINYLKGKSDPIALEDSEYPDWLWTLLAPAKTAATADGEAVGDLYCEFDLQTTNCTTPRLT